MYRKNAMTTIRICRFAVMLAEVAPGCLMHPQDADTRPPASFPSLANVCLITNDMKRLVGSTSPSWS
jgi:hypothetical protein